MTFQMTITIILFLLVSRGQSIKQFIEDEKIIPVFQPFPSVILNPLLNCPNGLTASIAPFNLKENSFVAISLTSCGLFIYNITDLLQPNIVFSDVLNDQGNTLGLITSHNQKYLWISHSTGSFYGMDLTQLPFRIIVRSHSNNNIVINRIQPWINNNDILFLFCNQMFQIFDWRVKSDEVRYLQSVNVNAVNSKSITFLRFNQYALVNAPNKGVQFYFVTNGDDIDKINFTYSCVLKPYFYDVSDFAVIDDNTIAVLMLYKGIFLYNMSNYFNSQGNSCTSTSFKYITQTPNQGMGGRLQLSQNRQFLYAAYRVVGIKIYDISKGQLQIVQEIKVESNCKDLILSEQEDFIFYSNSLTLQIFKRALPNFNRDIPNLLLNSYQASSYNWFKEKADGSTDYQCLWREELNQIFLARATFGVQLFQYSGNGILEGTSTIYNVGNPYPILQIEFLPDGVTAYISRQTAGFTIADYSIPSSPKIIKEYVTMNAKFVSFNYFGFFKDNTLGIVSNAINVLFFSIQDPLNPVLISSLDTMKFTLGETTAARFWVTQDLSTLIQCINNFGIISADISDFNNPIFISKIFTDGASEVLMTSDEKYVIVACNYQGMFIFQLNANKQLIFVSKVPVIGNQIRLLLLQGDKYVITTSYENPAVSLISISDINNPKVIQRFGNESQLTFGFYYMCLSQDKRELFVTNQLALYLLSLENQIILHSQIYELIKQQNSNEILRMAIDKQVPLKIGQTIEIHLVPIYQTKEIQLRKAFYYEEYVLQELPYWMTFYSTDKILRLSITKDSLKKDSKGNYIETVQQVVFLTYQTILNDAFVNQYLDITITDSQSLYKACIIEGYIDKLGYISQNYSPQTEINLGANEDQYLAKWQGNKQNLVKRFIQYTLNQNIINYTTQFSISQSLFVDISNPNEVIYTQQNDVLIQMSVLEKISDLEIVKTNKAKFVKRNYSGVLVLLSDKQDEMKIEGSLKNVNEVLKNGVKFAFDEKKIKADNILIQITISDGVNYNYDEVISYQNLPFLSKQSPIIIADNFRLQNDVFQKYSGGNIFIQASFQYQISQSVFVSKDEKELKYTAQMKINGEFQDIPKDFWMQYSSSDRVFSGTPLASDFKNQVTIQVNATDEYSYTLDTFTINPSKVPFTYVFQMAIQILGPLFGLFGFYKYKHFIYNVTFKQKYLYTKDVAYVGEVYRKQITITDNQAEIALKLWQFFLNRVGEQKISHELNSEKQQSFLTSSYEFYYPQQNNQDQDKEKQYEYREDDFNFEDEITKKMYPYGVNTDEMCFVDKKVKHIILQHSLKYLDESKEIDNSSNNITNQDIVQPSTLRQDKELCQDSKQEKQKMSLQETSKNKMNNSRKTSLKKKLTSKIFQIRSIVDNINHGIEINNSISRLKHLDINQQQQSPLKNEQRQRSEGLTIFDENGKINIIEILKFIREEQVLEQEKKRIASMSDLKNLQNPTSILSHAVICLLVEYLLNLDKVTKSLFDYMHQKALVYYKEVDWYKAYVNIKPQFEEIHKNAYPVITINEYTTKASLKEIFQSLKKYFYDPVTKSPKQIKFSLMLIEENIKAKVIGFSKNGPGYLQVSQGESIHAFCHTIHSLKAFQKNNDIICCMTIYKKLDLHYQEKGLTDNDKLPSWIHSIDLINGTIMLSGIPEKKDIGSIFFKVFDQEMYILRSYEIQVLQKLTNEPLYLRNQDNQFGDNSTNYFNTVSLQERSMLRSQKFSVFAPAKDEILQDNISQEYKFELVQNQLNQEQQQFKEEYNNFQLQNQTSQIVDSFIKPTQVLQDRPQDKPYQLDETFQNESFNVSNNNLKQNEDQSNNKFDNFKNEDRSNQSYLYSNKQDIDKYNL